MVENYRQNASRCSFSLQRWEEMGWKVCGRVRQVVGWPVDLTIIKTVQSTQKYHVARNVTIHHVTKSEWSRDRPSTLHLPPIKQPHPHPSLQHRIVPERRLLAHMNTQVTSRLHSGEQKLPPRLHNAQREVSSCELIAVNITADLELQVGQIMWSKPFFCRVVWEYWELVFHICMI